MADFMVWPYTGANSGGFKPGVSANEVEKTALNPDVS
jgi:hypothetical protein